MNKLKVRLIVDSITLVSFAVTAVSAFMGRGAREIHELAGKIFIISALIHIILSWRMFVGMLKNLFSSVEEIEKK